MNVNVISNSLSPLQRAIKISVISSDDKSQVLLIALWCILSIHNRKKNVKSQLRTMKIKVEPHLLPTPKLQVKNV